MRQLPHTDVKYCMAFSFVGDISFWTFASHQSDCHCPQQPEREEKNEDFTFGPSFSVCTQSYGNGMEEL